MRERERERAKRGGKEGKEEREGGREGGEEEQKEAEDEEEGQGGREGKVYLSSPDQPAQIWRPIQTRVCEVLWAERHHSRPLCKKQKRVSISIKRLHPFLGKTYSEVLQNVNEPDLDAAATRKVAFIARPM